MILFPDLLAKIARRLPKKNSLQQQLRAAGRTRWLDIGSIRFDPGFICADLHDPSEIPEDKSDRFIRLDLLGASPTELEALGEFDLVRLQHVFEHFSPEDGLQVLKTLPAIMATDAYIVITVPDLDAFVTAYRRGFARQERYRRFARKRVPEDAPSSFYFSVFAHQFGYLEGASPAKAHRWCYDHEGLVYQLKRAGGYKNIRKLGMFHPLAEIPFTHNRPSQDACVIAQKA